MISIQANTYLEDGIVITDYKDILIDIEIIKHSFTKRRSIEKNEKSLVIVKGSALLSLDKEIRDFLASKIVSDKTIAIALVPTSKAAKIITRVFISMKSTPFPIQTFDDVDSAKTWLLSLH